MQGAGENRKQSNYVRTHDQTSFIRPLTWPVHSERVRNEGSRTIYMSPSFLPERFEVHIKCVIGVPGSLRPGRAVLRLLRLALKFEIGGEESK